MKFHCSCPIPLPEHVVHLNLDICPTYFHMSEMLRFLSIIKTNHHTCLINSLFLFLLPLLPPRSLSIDCLHRLPIFSFQSHHILFKVTYCLFFSSFYYRMSQLLAPSQFYSLSIKSFSSSSSQVIIYSSSSSHNPLRVPSPIVPLWRIPSNKEESQVIRRPPKSTTMPHLL